MYRRFLVVALLGSLTSAAGRATVEAGGSPQGSATGATLMIAGRVDAADNDAALRRARVEVSSGSRRFDAVLSDDDGRFATEVSGPGPFVLAVSKAGYVRTTMTLSRDDAVRPLAMRLSRGAAVGGRAVDQRGRPAAGMAMTARPVGPAAAEVGPLSTSTDDFGEFRLGGLPPGRYEVVVSGNSLRSNPDGSVTPIVVERLSGKTVLTEGGAGISPAQTLVLGPGDDVSGIDFEVNVPDLLPLRAALSSVPRAPEPVLPPGAAGRIRGRLLSESGLPIDQATLRLSGPGGERPLLIAMGGQFSIAGLREGVYTISVLAAGGVPPPPQPISRTIALREDENIDGVDLVLPRGSTVSGIIVDEHGEPVQGARVYALVVNNTAGRLVAVKTGRERRTDDRGRYRISGLPNGSTYIIAASLDARLSRSGRRDNVGYAPFYYPGTPVLAAASPLRLAGDEDGVNIAVVPSSSAQVRGRAVDGAGPLVSGTARLLVSRRSGSIVSDGETVQIGADGAFAFAQVLPGEYVVQVVGDGPGRTGLFGRADVTVADTDPAPLTIGTSHGTTLEGRFVVEGELEPGMCVRMTRPGESVYQRCPATQPAFALQPIVLDPEAARERGSSVVTTGTTFWITGLFGRTAFALRGTPSDSWFLKSLTIGGVDVTDRGFDFGAAPQTLDDAEVVVARGGGTIDGRIDVERAAGPRDFAVLAFPTDRQLWFPGSRWMKFSRSALDGSFRVAGLPRGDYFLAAADELAGTPEAGEWQSGDVLEQLAAAAVRVSVAEGETRMVTLRLIRRTK